MNLNSPKHPLDLSGIRFGRLTCIGKSTDRSNGKNTKSSIWTVRCDCGQIKTVTRSALVTPHGTVSCGCYRRSISISVANDVRNGVRSSHYKGTPKHGASKTPTYSSYACMKSRCFYKNNRDYANYGGRGITVCAEWLGHNGFQNFLKSMGERPRGSSLDRIDSNGNYEPGNCRWADQKTQQNNRRNNIVVGYGINRQTLKKWCLSRGLNYSLIHKRYSAGWPLELAAETPSNKSNDLCRLMKLKNIPHSTVP